MTEPQFKTIKLLVKSVLENPHTYKWTLQGFGMLRTYFSDDLRLAVWDSRHMADPSPAMIHDHPWDFTSLIVAGELFNQRFNVFRDDKDPSVLKLVTFKAMCMTIKPGEGLRVQSNIHPCWLDPQAVEAYKAGDSYQQSWHKVHRTSYADGTVTLVDRDRGTRQDVARTFWAVGREWTTAEPRPATREEVESITQRSLERWFI